MLQLRKKDYYTLIKLSLEEDLNKIGDVTSDIIFPAKEKSNFILKAKQDGILCGENVFIDVFNYLDKKIVVEFNFHDKDKIQKGDIIANINGNTRNILKAERTALNFISMLSGISTKAHIFVKETEGKLTILDTRKTLPGMRKLQKYAVLCGGAENHRIGLYDMVMIKDNHIDAAGGITKAVTMIRNKWKDKYKIEVETSNIQQVKEALDNKVDRIMLDNMSKEDMIECIKLINKQAEVEASGNMTLERIKTLSNIGIDYISFGELTHTIKAFDFSLKVQK